MTTLSLLKEQVEQFKPHIQIIPMIEEQLDFGWQNQEEQQQMDGSGSGASASYSQSSSNSSPYTPAISGSTAVTNLIGQLETYMPGLFSSIQAQFPSYTSASTDAANQALKSTATSGAGLYNQLAPGLNTTAQQLGASNLQANTNALGSTLNSPGASSVIGGSNALQQQLNPAYNSTMSGLASLMSNQNPNGLSGSEQSGIERGLNQMNFNQGNANVQNPLTNIGNAMLFGQGLQQKQSNFANLANSATNTTNNLNGGQTGFGLTTGMTSGTGSANTNTNTNQFLTPTTSTFSLPSQATATSGGLFNQLGSTFNSANSAQAGQQQSSGNSTSAGIGCCFIFLEVYNGHLPWFVRQARDIAYAQRPEVGEGYKRMAKWLVPLMQQYRLVAQLVNELMVKPLTEQAGYQFSVEGCKPRMGYKRFWWFVWSHI